MIICTISKHAVAPIYTFTGLARCTFIERYGDMKLHRSLCCCWVAALVAGWSCFLGDLHTSTQTQAPHTHVGGVYYSRCVPRHRLVRRFPLNRSSLTFLGILGSNSFIRYSVLQQFRSTCNNASPIRDVFLGVPYSNLTYNSL